MKKSILSLLFALTLICSFAMQTICTENAKASTKTTTGNATSSYDVDFNKNYGVGRFVTVIEKNTKKPAECKSIKKTDNEGTHEAYIVDIKTDSTSNGKWKVVVYGLNEKYDAPKGTYWFTHYDKSMKKIGTCVAKKVK